MSRDDSSIDRRSVLKQVGAVGAASAAVGAASGAGGAASSSGTADSASGTVRPLPTDQIDVDGLLDELAGDVLTELAAAGRLGSDSASTLATAPDGSDGARSDRTVTGLYIDDTVGERSLVSVETRVDGGDLTVSVEPERDLAYAFFDPDDGTETLLYTAENGVERPDDVGTSSCPDCTCYHGRPCSEDEPGTFMEVCYVESTGGLPCVTRQGCC